MATCGRAGGWGRNPPLVRHRRRAELPKHRGRHKQGAGLPEHGQPCEVASSGSGPEGQPVYRSMFQGVQSNVILRNRSDRSEHGGCTRGVQSCGTGIADPQRIASTVSAEIASTRSASARTTVGSGPAPYPSPDRPR